MVGPTGLGDNNASSVYTDSGANIDGYTTNADGTVTGEDGTVYTNATKLENGTIVLSNKDGSQSVTLENKGAGYSVSDPKLSEPTVVYSDSIAYEASWIGGTIVGMIDFMYAILELQADMILGMDSEKFAKQQKAAQAIKDKLQDKMDNIFNNPDNYKDQKIYDAGAARTVTRENATLKDKPAKEVETLQQQSDALTLSTMPMSARLMLILGELADDSQKLGELMAEKTRQAGMIKGATQIAAGVISVGVGAGLAGKGLHMSKSGAFSGPGAQANIQNFNSMSQITQMMSSGFGQILMGAGEIGSSQVQAEKEQVQAYKERLQAAGEMLKQTLQMVRDEMKESDQIGESVRRIFNEFLQNSTSYFNPTTRG